MTRALAVVLMIGTASVLRAEPATTASPKIRTKSPSSISANAGLQPDSDVIDAPTTGVLDYRGYSTRSRFYSDGGILGYVAFGVYPGVNIGASAAVDSLVGDQKKTRVRTPAIQVKYRFYEGDEQMPSFATGYDGQGYRYNAGDHRFNQRQRGFYVIASKEIGIPGFQLHPSFNVSDFDTNSIFGCLPLTYNIRDKAEILLEWDNINNFSDSRLNAGLRAFLSTNFHLDFAVRAIGAGGHYGDGAPKGPERIVQLKYINSF